MTLPVIVWFKRDLRLADHEPLDQAICTGPILPLYIVEPEYWTMNYTSGRQWVFLKESLLDLDNALCLRGQPLWVAVGRAEEVLEKLRQRFGISQIFSHEETGSDWTFQRDRRVQSWCRANGVAWSEVRQHGVIRGLQRRSGWAAQWTTLMSQPGTSIPEQIHGVGEPDRFACAALDSISLPSEVILSKQPGGRKQGLELLDSFLEVRVQTYRQGMSSPLTAERVCSRLSTHLSLGTLSIREVWQRTEQTRAEVKRVGKEALFGRSLKSFASRLHWHCHFIQKLESEPRMEFHELHRGFIGLRDDESNSGLERFERFEQGLCGWPFVDACLRCLAQTGWLNFRMRAMLVSIASYHLWIDWRQTGALMARWFTDFEPGIHWSQIQMQSGTTGINANRMYSPIKQSEDQDPDGVFIKKWVPELELVPREWIHQPWRMPFSLQERVGCQVGLHYPKPIGDPSQLAREARAKLKQWTTSNDLRIEAARVLKTHGSRLRQARPRYGKKEISLSQLVLDLK